MAIATHEIYSPTPNSVVFHIHGINTNITITQSCRYVSPLQTVVAAPMPHLRTPPVYSDNHRPKSNTIGPITEVP